MDHLSAIKTRLAPWLNEPYFTVIERYHMLGTQQCTHENVGVTLDKVNRRAICNGCKATVDPFDALLHYAKSEQRLIGAAEQIKDAERRAREKDAREKARRPFLRRVTGARAMVDKKLKAEPIIGYRLTLECGHTHECGPNRQPKKVTCHNCMHDAREKPAKP